MTIERTPKPAQFTFGFSELEWLGYKAWYREGVARGQLLPDSSENHFQSLASQPQTLERGPTLEG